MSNLNNNQQDNFQVDLENLLKDLEEIDTNEFARQMNNQKFLNMKRDEEKRAQELQAAQQKQQKLKLQQMLEKNDRDQFNRLQQQQHAAQMSIDTKTVSDILKELDLVDYRPFPQEQAQFNKKETIQLQQQQNNPKHFNNISITSKILFDSNFEKDDSIIRIDTSFNNASGSNSSGNIPSNNNNNNQSNNTNPMSIHSRNAQNTQIKGNTNNNNNQYINNKLEYEESFDQQAQQDKLFKEFQLHEMQHQLLQDHFLNNNSIIQQNSIINNNSILINNTFLPSNSIQANNNNQNNVNINGNNNPNVNQTAGFDDIDNFLRQLDENETVLYSSSNDMLH